MVWMGFLHTTGEYQTLLPALQAKADAYLACLAKLDQTRLKDDTVQNSVTGYASQVDPGGGWGP
jgi:hypothetical protein